MVRRVRQKTVLVTGCTPGGIGYAVAREFKMKGFHVIATVRDIQHIKTLQQEGLDTVQLDVTDSSSIKECYEYVEKLVDGHLDILVNNAGRGLVTPATDIVLDDVRAVFETNLFGVMAMVQAFVGLLIPTKGLVINMSSVSALVPYVFGSVYASSKAALASYSRTLRQELRPFGIRVQVVMAGAVHSNMGKSAKGKLPENSLYQRVRHLYLARLGFSQKAASKPVPTIQFARKLVGDALAPEVSPFWRPWFGRPDNLYFGGMARLLYWASFFNDWFIDHGAWQKFGLYELEKIVKRDSDSWTAVKR